NVPSSPFAKNKQTSDHYLRAQLTDQIKVLDSQVEVKQQQLSDLSEFLRRRGDIEAEYARALDKLTERFTHKTKKKEQWGQSVCQVWSVLLTQTRLESREHAALGDTCCNTLTQRLIHSTEDTHRLHKRVSGGSVFTLHSVSSVSCKKNKNL
uniref:FCH domain-containing protein n=1 Tax=Seriola lalandi dorsalis TaxID=1841481 RepID=A0A3B4XG05_SERLL